ERPPPRLRRIRLDPHHPVRSPAYHEFASARRDDVAVPVDVLAIGQLGDEPALRRRHDDGRLVLLARLTPHVPHERERPPPGACEPRRPPVEGVRDEPQESPSPLLLLSRARCTTRTRRWRRARASHFPRSR